MCVKKDATIISNTHCYNIKRGTETHSQRQFRCVAVTHRAPRAPQSCGMHARQSGERGETGERERENSVAEPVQS